MIATTIYLIDSRLPESRSVRVHVRLVPTSDLSSTYGEDDLRFVALVSDYAQAQPLHLDLLPGTWLLEFASYSGTTVGCAINVPDGEDIYKIDAALLEGHIPNEAKRNLHYEMRESHQDYLSPPVRDGRAYRFIPSSARGRNSLKSSKTFAASIRPKVVAQKFIYNDDGDLTRRQDRRFTELNSFDEKFGFWMEGWTPVGNCEDVIIDIDRGPQHDLMTGKCQIRSDHMRPLASRTMLSIQFSDERYILLLPAQVDGDGYDTLDLEIDFYAVSISPAKGRILQTRILTNSPTFNGVAQLLGSGSLYKAKDLWTSDARELLHGKNRNPISAAAGALALVQPDVVGSHQYLLRNRYILDWLLNLHNDFVWITEGSVCLAWVLGSGLEPTTGDSVTDDEETVRSRIANLLTEAVIRGLPVYSEGLNLLSRGIDWASDDVSLDVRLAVRWLSLSSINAGPFLLLREAKPQ